MDSHGLKGSCFCGAVTVTCEGPPQSTLICHCTACRAWGGGMGQLATVFAADKVKVEGELKVTEAPFRGGYPDKETPGTMPKGFSSRKVCAKCYSCVLNDHSTPAGVIDVCGGILDWGKEGFKPQMHIQ